MMHGQRFCIFPWFFYTISSALTANTCDKKKEKKMIDVHVNYTKI